MSTVDIAFRMHMPTGAVEVQGTGNPAFDLYLKNDRAVRAFRSMHELQIAEAYVRGDIEIEGDAIKAMWLRDMLSDRSPWLKFWRRAAAVIYGRERLNPGWIQKHYDTKNVQTYALDRNYYAYTPGIYANDEETLEQSSQRKYEFAWEQLGLQPGMELLEIGCGWGGMTRFCASRGVKVTAITLSNDQLGWTKRIIEENKYDNAQAIYQDFFTFQPGRRFDAISCMGVIEDLSDYPKVMTRYTELLKPGARAYLDFAAGKVPVATSSFITKYVWPGTFRMVYMPELMEAIDKSAIQLQAVWNDRRNYYLWARNGAQRWVENKDKVVAEVGEEIYRLFYLLFLGTAGVMSSPRQDVSAYRMLLSNG